jgi:hypothetical protein
MPSLGPGAPEPQTIVRPACVRVNPHDDVGSLDRLNIWFRLPAAAGCLQGMAPATRNCSRHL